MSDTIVRKVIYEYLVNGEDYGLGSGEGRWTSRLPMPESVTNLDELIRYGASILDSITEQTLVDEYIKGPVGPVGPVDQWYQRSPPYDVNDMMDDDFPDFHVWYDFTKKVIPSSAIITGDCIPDRTIENYLADLMRPRYDIKIVNNHLKIAEEEYRNKEDSDPSDPTDPEV
jgi:hypothetical protein